MNRRGFLQGLLAVIAAPIVAKRVDGAQSLIPSAPISQATGTPATQPKGIWNIDPGEASRKLGEVMQRASKAHACNEHAARLWTEQVNREMERATAERLQGGFLK